MIVVSRRSGTIVTFYSYKGGTGRSMALANVAWVLASAGHRVLMVDWDLESPGLHRFFHPLLLDKRLRSSRGLMDLVWDFALAAVTPTPEAGLAPDWHAAYSEVLRYVVSIEWPFPDKGRLHLLPAGRQDTAYATRVSSFDWGNFYQRLGGGALLEAVKEAMRAEYDYVLVDSRTGLSDTSGICTVQLPDVLVCCFTLSNQSIEGAAAVAESVLAQRPEPGFRVLPVPMRVEDGEKHKLEAGRDYARRLFDGVLRGPAGEDRERYWAEVEVPYQRYYAYEEVLATIADRPRSEGTVLAAIERLTAHITDGAVAALAPGQDRERVRLLARYERGAPTGERYDFFVSSSAEAQEWATWVAWVLAEAGYAVFLDAWSVGGDQGLRRTLAIEGSERIIAILSEEYLSSRFAGEALAHAGAESRTGGRVIPVLIADVELPRALAAIVPIDLRGLDEMSCRNLLLSASAAGGVRPSALDPARPPIGALRAAFPGGDAAAATYVQTPQLAIFLGTTAALASLEFMRQARELPEADRRQIALVYIDIDHLHPELVRFRRRHAGMFVEKTIQLGVPRHIAHIPRVAQDGDPAEPHTYIGSRLPDAFANGSAGVRNNGHVAFCHDAAEVTRVLIEAIVQITSRDARGSLPIARGVDVHITSFVGGGTGSGIVADVACLVRQLLYAHDLDAKIELTCILPAELSGRGSEHRSGRGDSDLRRSNAVACMLEILALSMAGASGGRRYRKYVRTRYQELPQGPIAQEVYLIGDVRMGDTQDIARIAGMDLFQRALDASGVGALERSEAVNRISLGWSDDRGLPEMFGTCCPVEARFPAAETALAFAQMAAAEVLPRLAGPWPAPPAATAAEREARRLEWRRLAETCIEASVPRPLLSRSTYLRLGAGDLDLLWAAVTERAAETTRNLEGALAKVRQEQEARITPAGGEPPLERVRRWQALQDEYLAALQDVRQVAPVPLVRRADQERRAVGLLGPFGGERRLFEAHRAYLEGHALNEWRRLAEELLERLVARVTGRLLFMNELGQRANAQEQAAELRQRAAGSSAWRGRLDRPHPFQRHVLDAARPKGTSGANPAVERLYRWATTAVMGEGEDGGPDYGRFLPVLLGRVEAGPVEQTAPQLGETVVSFLQRRYLKRLQGVNLLQLLALAAPADGQRSDDQQFVERTLEELMEWMAAHMQPLVPFDHRIGGAAAIDAVRTEVFLSCSVRDGSADETLVREVAARTGILQSGVDHFRAGADPHRLQASYSQHGISLSTVYEFFSPVNSAMERYLRFAREWPMGTGSPPPHTCDALDRLVSDLDLVERLVREPGSGVKPDS